MVKSEDTSLDEFDFSADDVKGDEEQRQYRALVVEDEALIRLDIVETLTDAGIDVVGEAGDGQTAIEKAKELEPDVVVMDVKMPGMDGITAAEQILANRTCAVVMLTSSPPSRSRSPVSRRSSPSREKSRTSPSSLRRASRSTGLRAFSCRRWV